MGAWKCLCHRERSTCFQVWDQSGTYYQPGCTADSLQYWTDGNGVQHDYQWDVNEIIAPNEGPNAGTYRQIKLYYYQDTTSFTANGHNYTDVRDSNLEQIVYGAGALGSVTSVAGTVDFFYHGPTGYSHQSHDSSVNQTWVTVHTPSPCRSRPLTPSRKPPPSVTTRRRGTR